MVNQRAVSGNRAVAFYPDNTALTTEYAVKRGIEKDTKKHDNHPHTAMVETHYVGPDDRQQRLRQIQKQPVNFRDGLDPWKLTPQQIAQAKQLSREEEERL